jgi:hypothetical protein
MDEIKKDQLKPYVVLGTGSLAKMEKSFEKLAKQNSRYFDDFEDVQRNVASIEDKLPQLTAIKRASEAGGNALTSQEAMKLMDSIRVNVINETQKVQLAVQRTFAPLDVELKQTIDLLTSPNEDAQDAALDRIDDLRKAMGVDFDKVAAAMGANVKELIESRQFMRENRRKEDELKESTKQQMLEKRDQLREQGINTYLDEKTQTLRVKTIKDEKEFKKSIIADEKYLEQKRKETNELENKMRNQKTLTLDEEKLIIDNRQKLVELEKDLNKKKEEANISPNEKFSGFFSQTFGQAGDFLKNTFGEIGQMGKSLVGGFKNLPSLTMNFAKGLAKGALSLIVFALKAMLIVAAIVLFIYVVYKIVSTIMKAVDWIKSKLSWIFGDDEKEETDMQSGQGKYQSLSDTPNQSDNMESSSFGRDVKQESVSNESNIYNTDRSNKNQISNSSETMVPGLTPISPTRIQPIPRRQENVNQMSTELAATKSQGMNQVIAPTSMNNVTTNSTTQAVSSTPQNLDRSFINLNTVPV